MRERDSDKLVVVKCDSHLNRDNDILSILQYATLLCRLNLYSFSRYLGQNNNNNSIYTYLSDVLFERCLLISKCNCHDNSAMIHLYGQFTLYMRKL